MNNIFEPLTLSSGSHDAGSGKGCAMNVISWENGDTTITDYPDCSDHMLSRLVQGINDNLADANGLLSPENSIIALDLGHATVGTAYHGLSDLELRRVYTRCAVLAARKVVHLDTTGTALPAIEAAERWAESPTAENAAYAAYAASAASAASATFATYAASATFAAYAASAASAAYAASAANAAYAAYAASAASAASAAYAASATNAAYAASAAKFKIDLAWEIIALFKELTGTVSPEPVPEVVACAVEKMLVRT